MLQKKFRAFALIALIAAFGTFAIAHLMQPGPRAEANQKGEPAKSGTREDERKAIRAATEAYLAALNKGDIDGLMAYWTMDADYISETGQETRGRDAIAALFKKNLSSIKGNTFRSKTSSLKFLRGETALEDGVLEMTAEDGSKETNRFAIVWVKADGKWLMSSVRDLPGEVVEAPSIAYPQLKSLEWLVGDWEGEGSKGSVKLNVRWSVNKCFLLLDYTVKREDEEPLLVTQRIGWDPVNSKVLSWVFDSHGGFGEANWVREGKRWISATSGILPQGAIGGSTNTIEMINADSFNWRSEDREIDGEPMPDIELKFVRKAAK